MYRDEIWYRKLAESVDQHRDDLTSKQWAKYRIDHLLKVAHRVRESADDCETCRSYQKTLTRLEEELQELPGSKAQRQYQEAQLRQMDAHFVTAHRLAPPGYFLRLWMRRSVLWGLLVGVAAVFVTGNLLFLPLGTLVTAVGGLLYGMTLDQKVEREHRRI